MTGGDPLLEQLIDRLAVMPRLDRETVLAGLNEDECARLLPLMGGTVGPALSLTLSALVGQCRREAALGIAPRAAAALAQAANAPVPGEARMAAPPRSASWDRLSALWRAGA